MFHKWFGYSFLLAFALSCSTPKYYKVNRVPSGIDVTMEAKKLADSIVKNLNQLRHLSFQVTIDHGNGEVLRAITNMTPNQFETRVVESFDQGETVTTLFGLKEGIFTEYRKHADPRILDESIRENQQTKNGIKIVSLKKWVRKNGPPVQSLNLEFREKTNPSSQDGTSEENVLEDVKATYSIDGLSPRGNPYPIFYQKSDCDIGNLLESWLGNSSDKFEVNFIEMIRSARSITAQSLNGDNFLVAINEFEFENKLHKKVKLMDTITVDRHLMLPVKWETVRTENGELVSTRTIEYKNIKTQQKPLHIEKDRNHE